MGLGICGGKSWNAWIDARERGRGGAKGRTRERNMSWAGDRDGDVEDLGAELARKLNVSEKDQLAGFLRIDTAGPRPNGGRNCACGAVSVFRPGERDNWTGDQRRRRGRIFLKRRPSGVG